MIKKREGHVNYVRRTDNGDLRLVINKEIQFEYENEQNVLKVFKMNAIKKGAEHLVEQIQIKLQSDYQLLEFALNYYENKYDTLNAGVAQ